jgi:dihydropteroate synthase
MRPLVMGVLNVTPDSFSDGGRYLDRGRAIAHGLAMVAAGADVVDVGGESSRPRANPVPEQEELRRVVPVIEALAQSVRVSVDTVKPAVARAAIAAGATLVNDISASLWRVAAETGVGWVAMHMQGTPETMQDDPRYEDVVAEVRAFLLERADQASRAGVPEVWIDPGIGFGKGATHNLTLLHHLDALADTGYPLLVGVSRKTFLGRLSAGPGAGEVPPPEDRLDASLTAAVWALTRGAAMVRAHDVGPTVQAVAVVAGPRPAPGDGPSEGSGDSSAGASDARPAATSGVPEVRR